MASEQTGPGAAHRPARPGARGFDWTRDTNPFTDADDRVPARFVLEQVRNEGFRVTVPFRYHPTRGSGHVDVTDEALGDTDLASVPLFMAWFVSRFGRHTPAALVHDQLVRRGVTPRERAEADRIFVEAMDALGVPPVRSRIMWAAVSLATRWSTKPWGRLLMVLWLLGALAGTALLVHGIVTLTVWEIVLGLAGPLVGGVLWGRQYWVGVIAGFALWMIALPALASWLGYAAYWIVEEAVRWIRKLLPHNRGQVLPEPVSYREV